LLHRHFGSFPTTVCRLGEKSPNVTPADRAAVIVISMRGVQRTAVAVALAVAPTVMPAAHAIASGTPTPPTTGAWVLRHVQGGQVSRGHFTVTSNHKAVSDLQLTLSSGDYPGCGSGTIHVVGQQPIHLAQGTNIEHVHYSEWAVGRNAPKSGNVIQPVNVTLDRKGHQFPGKVRLAFYSPRGGPEPKSDGALTFTTKQSGTCQISFTFRKKA
jgi:hypothetical protein